MLEAKNVTIEKRKKARKTPPTKMVNKCVVVSSQTPGKNNGEEKEKNARE